MLNFVGEIRDHLAPISQMKGQGGVIFHARSWQRSVIDMYGNTLASKISLYFITSDQRSDPRAVIYHVLLSRC